MKTQTNEAFQKRVISYFENVVGGSKLKTVKHFQTEGKNRTTIYKIISRYQATKSSNYVMSGGRPAVVGTEKVKRKIEKTFEKNPSISVQKLAEKLKMKRSTVQYIKAKKLGIKSYTKKVVPKYVKNQEERAKMGTRFVYQKSLQKTLIIDDETYVPWDPQDVPGRKFFHAKDPTLTSYADKVKPKAKFFKKILVWQAMDENGNISQPFISEGTINSDVYLKECVKARLLPFIDELHNRDDVIFWPDMATAHYSQKVTSSLKAENVEFIPKSKNAPNVPQARGIEKFWALCKAEYSKRSSPPKSIRGFATVWKNISKKVAEKSGKAVMDSAKEKLIKIAYKGVQSS